ncbi:Ribokinase-like protein [Apiospora phragmitis]|uniref:Ribokinase-like protein n=1 Tax=Apiospora phragmitis TaxID=2905665 RepID=A0ABR1T329_9PEZI
MDSDAISFVSLGMLVLDELHLPSGRVLRDGIGGSGAWSMLGARIATGPRDAKQVGSFIVAGHDFPESAAQAIRELGVTLEMVVDPTRESTRGKLVYHDEAFNNKTFNYLTTPLQPTPAQLPRNLLAAKAFHMLLPPEAVMIQVPELLRRRKEAGIGALPLLVWEPLPWKCTPENMEAHKAACKLVTVFSPNHLELLGLYGIAKTNSTEESIRQSPEDRVESQQTVIERCAAELLGGVAADGWQGMLVVRAAEMGCFAKSASGLSRSFRPYHKDQKIVVDATGAGNAFLGALAVSLVAAAQKNPGRATQQQAVVMMVAVPANGDAIQISDAIVRASVVASFVIEQIGLPCRTSVEGANGEEQWNGDTFRARYERMADVTSGGLLSS